MNDLHPLAWSVEGREETLRFVRENGGSLPHLAARAGGITKRTMDRWINENVDGFGDQYEEAKELFSATILQAMVERGINGWDEPIYSQRSGALMGYKRVYDSRLLEILAKGSFPEFFRDQVDHKHKVSGGVLLVPKMDETDPSVRLRELDERQRALIEHHSGQKPPLP